MAEKQKRGKWLEVSFEVGYFDGDVSGKLELYCSKCGAQKGIEWLL